MKRAELKDLAAEARLQRDGFILIRNFLSKEDIQVLLQLYKEHHKVPDLNRDMWNSLFNVGAQTGLEISDKILAVLRPRFDALFVSYHTPVATFMSKNNTAGSSCEIHRDYSTQDESIFQYRNIWIPLVSTRLNNGALYALRGSNQVFDYVLPMFTEWPYKAMERELIEMADVIEADAGDLVIYLDKTLHGSQVNLSEEPRPVVHLGALNPDNVLCFYHLNTQTQKVRVYKVPFSFYFENDFGDPGDKYELIREFTYDPPALDADIVRARLSQLDTGV